MAGKVKIIGTTLMLIVLMSFASCSHKNDDASESSASETIASVVVEENEKAKGLTFPYDLDEGNLVINSLFQSSIENPDCGNVYAEDVASLEIVNQSGRFVESADITLTLGDGSQLHMKIQDIPDDQKVWVFECENVSFSSEDVCVSIDCDVHYLDEDPLMSDMVTVDAEGTTVTIVNHSEEVLGGLTVECHCLFDGVYYGGLTYSYPADELALGGSTVIEAEDCYLGTADVVHISE